MIGLAAILAGKAIVTGLSSEKSNSLAGDCRGAEEQLPCEDASGDVGSGLGIMWHPQPPKRPIRVSDDRRVNYR